MQEYLPDGPIDLLNVDCEGYDLQVLQTFDFSRSPRVIAAEDESLSLDSPLCAFLQNHNYSCKSHIGLTKIFSLEA